jgi:hypothetical protein
VIRIFTLSPCHLVNSLNCRMTDADAPTPSQTER